MDEGFQKNNKSYEENELEQYQRYFDERISNTRSSLLGRKKEYFEDKLKDVLNNCKNLKEVGIEAYNQSIKNLRDISNESLKNRVKKTGEEKLKNGLEMSKKILDNFLLQFS